MPPYDSILDVSNKGMTITRWSAEEDAILRSEYPRGSRDNVMAKPACRRCNHSKKDLSLEDWFASERTHNPRKKVKE